MALWAHPRADFRHHRRWPAERHAVVSRAHSERSGMAARCLRPLGQPRWRQSAGVTAAEGFAPRRTAAPAVMNALHDALSPAGPQAQHIADLWWLTLAITGAFFVAVLVALIVALRRRSGASEQTPADLASLSAGEPRARRLVIAA